jgi:hypothetical protein
MSAMSIVAGVGWGGEDRQLPPPPQFFKINKIEKSKYIKNYYGKLKLLLEIFPVCVSI